MTAKPPVPSKLLLALAALAAAGALAVAWAHGRKGAAPEGRGARPAQQGRVDGGGADDPDDGSAPTGGEVRAGDDPRAGTEEPEIDAAGASGAARVFAPDASAPVTPGGGREAAGVTGAQGTATALPRDAAPSSETASASPAHGTASAVPAGSGVPYEPPGTIMGRVADAEGNGIPGAQVRLYSGSRAYNLGATGPDGAFELDQVAAGRYRLLARAAGFQEGSVGPLVLAPAQVLPAPDVILKPGAGVTGTVVDPDGKPVAGARVWADRGGATSWDTPLTGDDGAFALGGLAAGRNRLHALAGGYLQSRPVPIDVPKLEGGGPGPLSGIVLALGAGAVIEGRVVGPDGVPIPVSLSLFDVRGGRRAHTQSDADGSYRFAGLTGGTYQVAVDLGLTFAGRETVTLGAGEDRNLLLAVQGAGSIAGTCQDDGGAPVPGAVVSAAAQGLHTATHTTADGQGSFSVKGLFDGVYVVTAVAPAGFAPPDPLTVTVAGGQGPRDLALAFKAGAIIEGRAIAHDGSPAGGVYVSAYDSSNAIVGSSFPADPAGRFRLAGLPQGSVTVFVLGAGDAGRTTVTLSKGDDRAVDVQLYVAGRIRGTVIRDGAPIRNADVELHSTDGIVKRSTRTDAKGTFALGDLYAGGYVLVARVQGAASDPVQVAVSESQQVEGVTLSLR